LLPWPYRQPYQPTSAQLEALHWAKSYYGQHHQHPVLHHIMPHSVTIIITIIGGLPMIVVSSVVMPANMLSGTSTWRCVMLSVLFGCSMFDVGWVGTYCEENQASQQLCKQKSSSSR